MRSAASAPLHVGWLSLHPDTSMNFQLNRWLAYGGDAWLRDVEPILPRLVGYDVWRDQFVRLGEAAEREGRFYIAGLHFRSAEFFMLESDARKQPTRLRLLRHLREPFEGTYTTHAVPFGNLTLTAYRFGKPQSRGTIVLFGGFDSYVEELFPMASEFARRGYDIVAFDGPGQGGMLEDQHVPMTADWHRPVAAVLDALGLDDVTLIGGSLGGCLVIRAAAFERRVQRVVAYDVMTDFHECLTHQLPQAVRPLVGALEHTGAMMDALVNIASTKRAVIEWGLQQTMRVFGVKTPHEAFQAARAYRTTDVSSRVTQDVLLLAGAEDHYVPLDQLWTQARTLTHVRSLTARVFTRQEQGQAHCQVGNIPLAIDVMCRWIDATERSQSSLQTEVPQSMNTEMEHLHIRMIAMENLLITILTQSPDQQLELGREMAAFISPRPGFTHHPRTVGAAAQMVHLLDRARHFQGWVEGDALS
jgi:alpha-beta hydrolase superfamily lysophospholipase